MSLFKEVSESFFIWMRIFKNVGKVLLIALLSGYVFGNLVGLTIALLTEPDENGNEYEAVVYGTIAMIPGAIVGFIYGVYRVFFKKKLKSKSR